MAKFVLRPFRPQLRPEELQSSVVFGRNIAESLRKPAKKAPAPKKESDTPGLEESDRAGEGRDHSSEE